jgi:methylase of polypeptide subunit release factors
MSPIASLLEHQGFMDIQTYRDLSGRERVISGKNPSLSRSSLSRSPLSRSGE